MAQELAEEDEDLIRLYALLALVLGVDTTDMDVHDAWAIWVQSIDPSHPSIRPFMELDPEIKALNEPYTKAIHRVAIAMAQE